MLAFVFASFMALVPLLMALVAIPTTFLLVWPLAARHRRLGRDPVPRRPRSGSGSRSTTRCSSSCAGARSASATERRTSVGGPARDGARRLGGRLQRHDRRDRAARARRPARPLPPQHRHRRHADPARERRGRDHAAAGDPRDGRAAARLAPDPPRGPRQPRLDRLGAHRRPPPLGRGARLRRRARRARRRRHDDPARSAARRVARADPAPPASASTQLERSGIGPGPLTPVRGARARAAIPTRSPRRSAASKASARRSRRPSGGATGPRSSPSSRPSTATRPPDTRPSTASAPRRGLCRADVVIGGQVAQTADFVDAVYGNFPLMIALIAVLTFVLLARAFRSLVLPLKAVLLNVLSVAAAWGLMVLVWQNGLGSEAIWGIEATRSINAEMPITVFAFLFGLSMDYQVFIISRMREAYDRTGSTDTAVVEGIGRTGPPRHQRGADPRPRLRRPQRQPRHRDQDLRDRARRRDPARRHHRPRRPRARRRRAPRPLELVAAARARAPAARRAVARRARRSPPGAGTRGPMSARAVGTEHAVVVGGGPAGLVSAVVLERAGVRAVVLDRSARVAEAWRRRYDRLRPNTSRLTSSLPGLRCPPGTGMFPTRDEFVSYLERYVAKHRVDLRLGVSVDRLDRARGGTARHRLGRRPPRGSRGRRHGLRGRAGHSPVARARAVPRAPAARVGVPQPAAVP